MLLRFLKSYLLNRNFFWILIVFAILFLFFSGYSYAATGDSITTGIDKVEISALIDLLLKIIYILLWPLLVIAGLSIDNSLVYGSFLHMDAVLFSFWNIMKNFANFTLGFVVLFAILKKIFSFGGKDDGKRAPQKIITQTLIAGVLIQISWFIMGVLVDISTITTYAIGALPLNVVGSTELGKHKIMQSNVEIDISKFQKNIDENDYFKVSYSVPATLSESDKKSVTLYFSECKVKNGYIIGRMDGNKKFDNTQYFGGTKNACVYGGQLVFFNEFPDTAKQQDHSSYQSTLDYIVSQNHFWDARESCNLVIRLSGKKSSSSDCEKSMDDLKKSSIADSIKETINHKKGSRDRWTDPKKIKQIGEYGFVAGDNRLQNKTTNNNEPIANALSLDELVDKSKGFVGPLLTIYSSLLDFAQLANNSSSTSFGVMSSEMLIKTGFAIGLFFPLIALAIVFFIRIGFMRAAIVLSPFLVLIKAFGWEEKLPGSLKTHFTVANVIKVIFAPVLTVFALSISLIFMSALTVSIKEIGTENREMKKIITDNPGTQGYSFLKDCLQLQLHGFENFGGALDVFSWILVNLIGIGIMRGIVFAAIRANSIGAKIGKTVQEFGASLFQTLPILPLPTGDKVGLGTFVSKMGNVPRELAHQRDTRGEQKVQRWLYGEEKEGQLSKENANKIVNQIASASNPDVEKIVQDITNSKEEKIGEYFTSSTIPTRATAIEKLSGNNKAKVKEALGKKLEGGKFRYEKYKINEGIAKVKNIEEANDEIKKVLEDLENKNEFNEELKKNPITITINDKEYELKAQIDSNNNNITGFTFVEKNSPQGNKS